MGFSSRQPVHARHRHGADCRHDPRKAAEERFAGRSGLCCGLITVLLTLAWGAAADTLRVATFHAELHRAGPGLLLRDILGGADPQVAAAVAVIAAADPDVLLLLGFDHDLELQALSALAARLAAAGAPYPHRFATRPNTGMATGLDLDGNGRRGEARDAQGYGRFAGEGGMAVLSRLPVRAADIRDFSAMPWRDLPGHLMPPGTSDVQRLATTALWEVPLDLPGGATLRLLGFHASPPVFDGPEDRNGRRNHDEAAFWLRLLEGALPQPPPAPPFVLLGDANLDPARDEGRPAALRVLLAHPALQDPLPAGPTADFSARDGPGRLRVDYVLPSADLMVTGAGVLWPPPGDPLLPQVLAASRHRLVWVDLGLP